jgi:ribosomal protein L16/L10AE
LLEIKGVSRKVALKAFKVAQSKICLKIDFIEREIIDA